MEQHANTDDKRLLARYVRDGSQAAFARLVERHLNLVYSICYRELRRRELAEEATQAVFIVLARGARGIRSEAALVSWLYTTARFQASVLRRQEMRRMTQERLAAEELLRAGEQSDMDAWASIEPALNDAIDALPKPDRLAILLRFFEEKSLREVGLALGSSEDAARMRVTRALEKLRTVLLRKRAADVSVTTLAALLAAHTVHTVPTQVAAGIVTSASAGSAHVANAHASSLLIKKGALIIMDTTIKKAAIAVGIILLLLGGGVAITAAIHHAQVPRTASAASGQGAASDPYVQWATTHASDPATRTAEQQVQAQLGRYIRGQNHQNLSDVLDKYAVMSPDCIFINPNGNRTHPYQNVAGRQINWDDVKKRLPDESVTAKINSCRIDGNTAIVGFDEYTHMRTKRPGIDTAQPDDYKHIYTFTFTNTGGQWLITTMDDVTHPDFRRNYQKQHPRPVGGG